jgi:hypothetical protein
LTELPNLIIYWHRSVTGAATVSWQKKKSNASVFLKMFPPRIVLNKAVVEFALDISSRSLYSGAHRMYYLSTAPYFEIELNFRILNGIEMSCGAQLISLDDRILKY